MAGRAGDARSASEMVGIDPLADEELLDRLVHDLRNPLGVIAYFAEVVGGATALEREELCERLRINAQRALHILEEFSLLAELRNGACRPALESFDVSELTKQLTAEVESVERRPAQIRCHLDAPSPMRLPRQHLACVLRALLRAALRVSARDGGLELRVRNDGRQMAFAIQGFVRLESAGLPEAAVELELAERMADLYRGRCAVELHGSRVVITLSLPGTG
jgi:signal transduction histidine kinase